MAQVFISFKDYANFAGKKNANLAEIWRDSYMHAVGEVDEIGFFFATLDEVKRLRSGLYVYIYVRPDRGETITEDDIMKIARIIFDRGGIAWSTMGGKIFAIIPRWGKKKIVDKDGIKYDLKRAIKIYAKTGDIEKTIEIVNSYRIKKGKVPYEV